MWTCLCSARAWCCSHHPCCSSHSRYVSATAARHTRRSICPPIRVSVELVTHHQAWTEHTTSEFGACASGILRRCRAEAGARQCRIRSARLLRSDADFVAAMCDACRRSERGESETSGTRKGRLDVSLVNDTLAMGDGREAWTPHATTHRPTVTAYAIVTLRGNCPLSSRNVFLVARSAVVGCTAPLVSVTRDTSVCSPGVAPVHSKVNSFQE